MPSSGSFYFLVADGDHGGAGVRAGPEAPEPQRLGKVEAPDAIGIAPGLKVKISGGLNLPSGGAFRIGVIF